MSERLQLIQKIVDEIKEAVSKNCDVFVGGNKVKTIDILPSKNGAIIIINDNITYYASRFLQLKRMVVCRGQQ